jgi:hypothetical protein
MVSPSAFPTVLLLAVSFLLAAGLIWAVRSGAARAG